MDGRAIISDKIEQGYLVPGPVLPSMLTGFMRRNMDLQGTGSLSGRLCVYRLFDYWHPRRSRRSDISSALGECLGQAKVHKSGHDSDHLMFDSPRSHTTRHCVNIKVTFEILHRNHCLLVEFRHIVRPDILLRGAHGSGPGCW